MESFKKKDYKTSLIDCFLRLDQLMLSKDGKKELNQMKMASGNYNYQSEDDGEFSQETSGCTASVVLISKTEIFCANAGDSRTVLSKKGKSKDLSVDHKPDTPSEKARIEKANGFVEDKRVNGNLSVSRAFGDFEFKSNSLIKA